MHNFLSYWTDFNLNYENKLGTSLLYGRFHTMKAALNLFLQLEGSVIVETGCQYAWNEWGAGCSTQIFSEFARSQNVELYTVDHSEEHLKVTRLIADHYPKHFVIHNDSIQFLSVFNKKINLLYLDSMDYPYGKLLEEYGGKEDLTKAITKVNALNESEIIAKHQDIILASQQHCLNELQTAMSHLAEKCIVLIDDNNLAGGGKARLAKLLLEQAHFLCILDHYQSLWIRI